MNLRFQDSWFDLMMLGLVGTFGVAGFAITSNQVVAQQQTFPDVKPDYWASPFIQVLADKGIITGYPDGTFKPETAVDRDEFAAIIRQAFNQEQVKKIPSGSSFTDLPLAYWAEIPIEEAYESGFMQAYTNNKFLPRQELSKVEALVTLTKGLNMSYPVVTANQAKSKPKATKGKTKNRLVFPLATTVLMQPFYQISSKSKSAATVPIKTATKSTPAVPTAQKLLESYYQDAQQVPESAVDNVAAATQADIVVNYPQPKVLNPNQAISRGTAAALIHQALVYRDKLNSIRSDSPANRYIVNYKLPNNQVTQAER